MVIQNTNNAVYYNNTYNNTYNFNQTSNDENITINNNENNNKNEKDINMDKSILKTINAPTKIYIDNVISNALDNIARGNNIEDNKRIIRLFSNLIHENPENMLRKAYGI